ncbi:DNA polymerase-3 subunit beta [Paenibacillus amylolyticus]|uniref:Beta sliding clamp n=1 Tax=Paenibacillus amylolyticus TaxID=1451 RepID=A0AAP5LR39_PAEAM|nr:DNA polymerase III subunit beta [Paenibacillus amylolyticus]MDR6726305.1 DNA polymerase-3 subunit beta [Paenibacillus amylolyticus]
MLVHISKDCLTIAIQHVLKAVSASTPVPILTGIHIQAFDEEVILTASNSSLTIQYRISQHQTMNVLRPGRIVIPAKYMYEVVRKCDKGIITLEVVDPRVLTIRTEHSFIRLSGMDPEEFPVIHDVTNFSKLQIQLNSVQFNSCIKQVTGVVSTAENRPVLTGVRLSYSNELLHMTATDGIRFASRTLKVENKTNISGSAIVPGKNLYEVSKILDHEEHTVEIEIGLKLIRFTSQNIVIQSNLLEGVYPVTHSVIPTSCISDVIVNTSLLMQALERATVLASERVVRIEATSNNLEIKSTLDMIGDVLDQVPMNKHIGEHFNISFNGKFLKDIINSITSDDVRIQFTGKMSPLVIQPLDEKLGDTIFLITPVRTAI